MRHRDTGGRIGYQCNRPGPTVKPIRAGVLSAHLRRDAAWLDYLPSFESVSIIGVTVGPRISLTPGIAMTVSITV